jgi:hypothetical protein
LFLFRRTEQSLNHALFYPEYSRMAFLPRIGFADGVS